MRRVLKFIVPVMIVVASAAAATGALGNGTSRPEPWFSAVYSFDATRGMPVEGSVSYIVLRRKPGGTVLRAELRGNIDMRAVSTPLRRGRYRISAYQRLCNGNCTNISPPSHACGRDIRMPDGRNLSARIHVRWTAANAEDQPHCRINISR